MYGLAAISANNGWGMAIVGLAIVITGMTTLSFLISQLHKILSLWENKDDVVRNYKSRVERKQEREQRAQAIESLVSTVTPDFKESVRQFGILVEAMDDPFSLPKLLDTAKIHCLTAPHSTIIDLIQSDLIVPDGKGYYTWNVKAFEAIMNKA